MMFHAQGPSRHCSIVAVFCSKIRDSRQKQDDSGRQPTYPFHELASSGRLEVHVLIKPTNDELRRVLDSSDPSLVYLQGRESEDTEEIGPLSWDDVDLSNPEVLCGAFGSKLPNTVYLETPKGEKMAEALHSKGVPYVIYWNDEFSKYAGSHFRWALFSVVQSSYSHTWDAFQLAHASFRLYCVRNNNILPSDSPKISNKNGPRLLGDPPKIDVIMPEVEMQDEESSTESLPAIKIYDENVTIRFLVCGVPCTLDACLLGSLEDGLNALLSIEVRGSKLHNRTSAPPPPLQAGAFARGVVTMRCDISTSSSAHISLLISGSADTCFNDQILENHIKKELIEKSQLVHALPHCEQSNSTSELRKSSSIACGASVFEVCMQVPFWASQVLRQLAPDALYRSLVALGVASIQGLAVASFDKDDAECLLYFCTNQRKEVQKDNVVFIGTPSWLVAPPPSRKRPEPCQKNRPAYGKSSIAENNGNARSKLNVAAMRPIPHAHRQKMLPFSGFPEAHRHEGDLGKVTLPVAPSKNNTGTASVTHKKSSSNALQVQQVISLNPLPLKKHGCERAPIQVCSEEVFLRDVMQFLIHRGHTRLIPQGGFAEFPEAILNAKRLDLYNLYKEVVSRGGFHVGNGINWKGQVFSKMSNHTLTNRMTGVGNTLKRHYETYLLEYELAHDDVDGECCLLCHSSAAGDWVNCGICGEWAHFGCDRRQGLGAFKVMKDIAVIRSLDIRRRASAQDYAKTDGLEYICPHCSVSTFKKKTQKTSNGY